MKYVKETALGGLRVAKSNEAEAVILELGEYKKMLGDLENLKVTLANEQKNAERLKFENEQLIKKQNVEKLKSEIKQLIERQKLDAEMYEKKSNEVNELKNNLEISEHEIEKLKKTKLELKKICIEKSNKNNNLRPKKEHTGYAVTQTRDKDIKLKFYGKGVVNFNCQETIFLTPFPSNFEINTVKKLIYEDMNNQILELVGIDKFDDVVKNFWENDILKEFKIQSKEENFNVAFKLSVKNNLKEGYYYVTILHTKPIKKIPSIVALPEKETKLKKGEC